MYHDRVGYGQYGGPPPDHFFSAGMSTLFLLAFVGLVVWAATMYFHRTQAHRQLAAQAEPSAIELLSRRYVIGQIDLETFENMVYHVLESEQREHLQQLRLL